jgi:hypothetical protein
VGIEQGVIASIILFLIVQLGTAIWWASKVSATLGFIAAGLARVETCTAGMDDKYLRKTDAAEKHIVIEKNIDAIWKRLDNAHACPNHKG